MREVRIFMKAAALNVKGIVAMDLNQDANAKEFFNQAIQAYPEFVLPKGNLTALAQREAKAAGLPAPKSTPAPKPTGK